MCATSYRHKNSICDLLHNSKYFGTQLALQTKVSKSDFQLLARYTHRSLRSFPIRLLSGISEYFLNGKTIFRQHRESVFENQLSFYYFFMLLKKGEIAGTSERGRESLHIHPHPAAAAAASASTALCTGVK
jgi:hypothetical protein